MGNGALEPLMFGCIETVLAAGAPPNSGMVFISSAGACVMTSDRSANSNAAVKRAWNGAYMGCLQH
jgi:hypothetical protein